MTFSGQIRNSTAVLDQPIDLPDGTLVSVQIERVGNAFWQSKTLEEVLTQQGIAPVQSLDELAGKWPEEDSVDDFLVEFREIRH